MDTRLRIPNCLKFRLAQPERRASWISRAFPRHIDQKYGESWFYVSSRFQISGANEPEEVERRVVEVAFSDSGMVSNVATYSLEDGRVIPLTRRVTENNLGRVTILEQLGRAFGRVDPGAILTGE